MFRRRFDASDAAILGSTRSSGDCAGELLVRGARSRYCSKTFVPKHIRHRYCSQSCWGAVAATVYRGTSHVETRKVDRPSYEQLMADVESMSFLAVGRKYGVSDNAVRKWIRWSEYKAERERADGGDRRDPDEEAA